MCKKIKFYGMIAADLKQKRLPHSQTHQPLLHHFLLLLWKNSATKGGIPILTKEMACVWWGSRQYWTNVTRRWWCWTGRCCCGRSCRRPRAATAVRWRVPTATCTAACSCLWAPPGTAAGRRWSACCWSAAPSSRSSQTP